MDILGSNINSSNHSHGDGHLRYTTILGLAAQRLISVVTIKWIVIKIRGLAQSNANSLLLM